MENTILKRVEKCTGDDDIAASIKSNIMLIEPDDLLGESGYVPHEFMHQHDGIVDDVLTRDEDESHEAGGSKSDKKERIRMNYQNAIDLGKKQLPYIGQPVFDKIKKEYKLRNKTKK